MGESESVRNSSDSALSVPASVSAITHIGARIKSLDQALFQQSPIPTETAFQALPVD